MRISAIILALVVCAPPAFSSEGTLLKAFYTAINNSDPEYGQVAVEKTELPHREVEHFVWLILVPDPPEPLHWQRKLNAAVDPRHGSFRVTRASAEEERLVAAGKIKLQR